MIHTVVSVALSKGLQIGVLCFLVGGAVNNFVPELPRIEEDAGKLVDPASLTVPVVRDVKHEIGESCFDNVKMEKPFVEPPETIKGEKVKVEDGFPTR